MRALSVEAVLLVLISASIVLLTSPITGLDVPRYEVRLLLVNRKIVVACPS